MCNNAVINGDTLQGQPTEGALLAVAMKVFYTYHILLFISCNSFMLILLFLTIE